MTDDLTRVRPDPRPAPSAGGIGQPKRTKPDRKPSVADRSGGVCEVRVDGCYGEASAIHHRKRRSQGGTNDLLNLLHVCAFCHGHIHAHVAASYANGRLVLSTEAVA